MNGVSAPSLHVWVLRNPILSLLPHIISAEDPAEVLLEMTNAFRTQRGIKACLLSSSAFYNSALLQVRVEMRGRGSPGDMAQIHSMDAGEVLEWENAHQEDQDIGRVWIAGEGKSAIQEVCAESGLGDRGNRLTV